MAMARKKRTSKTIIGWAATRGRRGIIKQAESDLKRGLRDTDAGRTRTSTRKRGQ